MRAADHGESARLHALTQLKLLDTSPSESFDRITRLAGRIFGLPIAAVSLTDQDRQWFKSRIGVEHRQIPREKAPCAEVADTGSFVIIPDLLDDPHYRQSTLAKAGIRFYAGAPLLTREGYGLGAMCVLGTEPRSISPDEQSALSDLAAMVMGQIELQHAFGRVEPLSGLSNRNQFLDDLQDQARDHLGKLRSAIMVEIIENSRLSEALRVLGAGAMDDLTRIATQILSAALGPSVKIYQVAPTHFAWLMSHRSESARQRTLARMDGAVARILSAAALPQIANPVLGIVPFRLGQANPDDVLRTAHSAAQDARNADVRVRIYSEQADNHHKRRFRLLSDMRDALDSEDQLSLVYQPRVDLRSGACVGVEALLRWHHPMLGPVSPGEFIPSVEQTDLARALTDWVVTEAIRQSLAWRSIGLEVAISVNVSASNLEEADFSARLIAHLASSGLPSRSIDLEVTESALIRDGGRVGQQLRLAREAGIKISIDDFGTGYSSLSYLRDLPVDTIKIDQSFVRDLVQDDRLRRLFRSMVDMARSLEFRVVAEGVEDADTFDFLSTVACEEAQGYWISRPLRPDDFAAWISARDSSRVPVSRTHRQTPATS